MEEKTEKKLLELVKRSNTYKIIIPEVVEKKIRLLCKNIWDVEWSGVLFYKVEGSFEDNSLAIRCVDIYQMDIGTGTYTEFNMSADIATYMIDHPELMDGSTYQGLIHSHNNMATFFSGTDTSTLKEEGNEMAHFVSLIVNNAGSYTAAVTRRYKCVQVVQEEFTYPSWGDTEVKGVEPFTVEEEYIEWFNLNIEFENQVAEFEQEMLARINEIKENKNKKKAVPALAEYSNFGKSKSKWDNWENWKNQGKQKDAGTVIPMDSYYREDKKKGSEDTPFQGETKKESKEVKETDAKDEELYIPYGYVKANPKTVDLLVKQLLTTSVIINSESKVDINKWAASMGSMYKKRFGTVDDFSVFAGSYVDYLINNTIDDDLLIAVDGDPSTAAAILAFDVQEALEQLPANPWLKEYIEQLELFII